MKSLQEMSLAEIHALADRIEEELTYRYEMVEKCRAAIERHEELFVESVRDDRPCCRPGCFYNEAGGEGTRVWVHAPYCEENEHYYCEWCLDTMPDETRAQLLERESRVTTYF